MNLGMITQMIAYRLAYVPAFLQTYGPQLAKDRTLSDKKLTELARILVIKRKNGLISTKETWGAITDTTLTTLITSIGTIDDQTLGDEVLVTLYKRLHGLHVIRDKTLAAITHGDVGDAAWESLVRVWDSVIRNGKVADPNNHYGGELTLTDPPTSLYEEMRKLTTASLNGTALTTGISFLDIVGCAPVRRDVMLIIGHSGTGKSYLLDAMALANAAKGLKVVIISLEMTVYDRMARIEGLLLGTVTHQDMTFVRDNDNQSGIGLVAASAIEVQRFGNWRNYSKEEMCTWVKHSDGTPLAFPVNKYIIGRDGQINQATLSDAVRVRGRLKECGGDVKVRAWPVDRATTNDIELYLDDLVSDGYIPDIVMVDYPWLLDLGGGSSEDDTNHRREALLGASRQLKRLAQKYNSAVIFVHQAKDTSNGNSREKHMAGDIQLARPPITKTDSYGAKGLIYEAAVGLGLNELAIKGTGSVANIIKTRNSQEVSEMLFIQTGFPARYSLATHTVVHQVHQNQSSAKSKEKSWNEK